VAEGQVREPDLGRRSIVGKAWLASGPPFCVIAGEPGSGKTTLLRFLALQASQDPSYFPVFVPLTSVNFDHEGPLLLRALDWGLSWLEVTDIDHVQEVRSLYLRRVLQGQAVVILDGFDELLSDKQAKLLDLVREGERVDFGGNKIVLSTRRIDSAGSISKASFYEIAPLSAQQKRELVRGLIPDPDAAEQIVSLLYTLLDAGIAAFPIGWLGLIARFISERKPPLGSALEVMADLVEYGLRGISTADIPVRAALARLAYQGLWSGGTYSPHDLNQALAQLGFVTGLEQLVEALAASPLVVAQKNKAPSETYTFSHRLIQEYLAALDLSGRPDPVMAIASTGFDARFSGSDVPAMAVGLIDNPNVAIATFETLPDSLNHVILSLRARTMRFTDSAGHAQVERIADNIEFLIRCPNRASIEGLRALGGSLVGANRAIFEALSNRIRSLLQGAENMHRYRALLFVAAARFPGVLSQIAPSLVAEDENVREAAATALGELRDTAAIPMLVQAYLNNPGNLVFQPAVSAIRAIGGPLASEALIGLLSNKSLYRNLRWPIADELGLLGDPAVTGALIVALKDEADVVREHAAGALGLLSAKDALDDMHQCLSDPEVGVRIRAARALGLLRDRRSAVFLLRALGDVHPVVREEAALALARVDQDALLGSLRKTVADASISWRGFAAALLAEMLGYDAVPILRLLCRDSDSEAREGAARGLALIPHDDAKSLLMELIRDEMEGVRCRAIEGLARQEHFAAVPHIIDRLQKDESTMVRMEAAKALRGLGDSAAVSPLISVVEFDPMIGPYAALALGELKDETAIPVLAAAWLRQQYDFLREFFAIAIGRIDGATAAAVLRELFVNEDEKRRVEIAQAFHEMRDVNGVPGMFAGLADSSPAVRRLARRSLQSLSYQELTAGIRLGLADAQSIVRLQAVQIAPFYADDSLGETLGSLFKNDPDPEVRQQSAVALEQWGRKQACLKGALD
jgi:HEAT repeat protein